MPAFLLQTEPEFFALEAQRVEVSGHLLPGDRVTLPSGLELDVIQELPQLGGLRRFYCRPHVRNPQ